MNKKILQTYAFTIDNDLRDELKYLGKKKNASLSVILLSAFKVLLFRHTEQSDLHVATPNATFSNILSLKTSLNGEEPFEALLIRIKETLQTAHLHLGKTFEESVRSSSPAAGIHNSLYQYLFILQNYAEEELNRDKFDETVSKFGLTLSITQTADFLQCYFIYARHAYNEEIITQMAGHYKELLRAGAQQEQEKTGELTMLTQAEYQLLDQFNNTKVEYPEGKTIIDLFERQAGATPDAIAVVFKNQKLTYRQVNERTNRLAHLLQSRGVTGETVVPILLERSSEMIVAILAIWKAGGAYVPIDHESPPTRIAYVLKDTGAKLVLCDTDERKQLLPVDLDVIAISDDPGIVGQSAANLGSRPAPADLAYIIYTSGSTGKPKGVMVEHKSIFNYILASKAQFISENERSSGTFVHLSYTFDASLKSMLTPLVSGKLIVISSKPLAYVFEDPNLHKYAPYDFIQLTPSHLDFFYLVYKDGDRVPVTGKISIGGDALYKNHFDPLIEAGNKLQVINEYGPTEATVACSSYSFEISGNKIPQRLPIGKPVDNSQMYILNEHDQPVPVGVTGEICVGGIQVARGYLNSPDLTRKRFIANPFYHGSAEKIYKTGDMGRWLPDGNIECLGRKDDQVKIRGYRVEPGEIESILIKNEMIRQVTVIPKDDGHNGKRLVAYVVPNGIFNKNEIISYLQVWLPSYMIPESWIIQEELPLTLNGKIDRNVLPEPGLETQVNENEPQENFQAPRTREEQTIASIWQDVLGVQQVGINDNFFEVGEPSILAIKVLRLVEEMTGKYLPLSTIYENPTLEKFVKRLQDTK